MGRIEDGVDTADLQGPSIADSWVVDLNMTSMMRSRRDRIAGYGSEYRGNNYGNREIPVNAFYLAIFTSRVKARLNPSGRTAARRSFAHRRRFKIRN